MKYFYDCEFIEDGKTIDLISIGIVAEDGRELYLQNAEAKLSKASDWVVDNVFPSLRGLTGTREHPVLRLSEWDTRHQIAEKLRGFIPATTLPEFWGYYSAYDHVALCQLFGTMMDLPRGWPMYTRDLRQWADSHGITEDLDTTIPAEGEHHALADARWNKKAWEYLQSL
jgi:hypothetical protein